MYIYLITLFFTIIMVVDNFCEHRFLFVTKQINFRLGGDFI